MKYRYLRITAYNETPWEADSFHVDVQIDTKSVWTQQKLLDRLIKPAFNCVYSRMIPEMWRNSLKDMGLNR